MAQQAAWGQKPENEAKCGMVAGDDDGTPEFLKGGEELMGSPRRSTVMKSRSPKQKRVTPPRYGGSREAAGGGGVGGGGGCVGIPLAKKFILQALPSGPSVGASHPNG
jgi:hypothetical protein